MSGERTGHGVVLKVNTGTVGVPVWTAIGSQRGLTITPSGDVVDISSKESLDRAFKGGLRTRTISLDALFVKDTTDYNKLKTAFDADDDDARKVQVCEVHDDTNRRWIYAYITSMPTDFPYDGEATISIELQTTGSWTDL